MSKSFGYLEGGVAPPTFAILHRMLHSTAWAGQIPWVFWLNDFVTPYIGNQLAVNNRHGAVRQLALQEVNARTKGTSQDKDKPQDILATLLAVHDEKPSDFSYDDIVSMATSNVGAGSDTTAISLRAVFRYLLKLPHTLNALMAEMRQAQQDGKLSDPVQTQEAAELPYLQACLQEALRLHPAVSSRTFQQPRVLDSTPPPDICRRPMIMIA